MCQHYKQLEPMLIVHFNALSNVGVGDARNFKEERRIDIFELPVS